MQIILKARKIGLVLKRMGLIRSINLIYICFILPNIMKILPIYLIGYKRLKLLIDKINTAREMKHWNSIKEEILCIGEKGYKVKIEDLGLTQANVKRIKGLQQFSPEIVIAEIDQDGFLLSHFGLIENAPTISKEKFLPRIRYKITIVSIKGYVGVKKYFIGDKLSFIYELRALHILALAGSNVPSIMDVDFRNLTITFSYILGQVIREELAKRGALIRDRDVNKKYLSSLSPREVWLMRINAGKRVLYDVVDKRFVDNLFSEICKIHSLGFLLNDIKYGNIIIEHRTKAPYLIDFNGARWYPTLKKNLLRIICDRDVELFNLHFNTDKLTYKIIKEKIKNKKIRFFEKWYAPVYFGSALRIGAIWNTNVGYGRWDSILKENLPPLLGKRILELGANNAFNAIQFLRSGAREVIGIELNKEFIAQGMFVKEVYEWADKKIYNFRYINSDMRDVLKMKLGQFDIVIALCCIYYLDDGSIEKLIQYISKICDIFVLQCNIATSIGRKFSNTYNKASIEYNVNMLKKNGFPLIEVIAPPQYSRPLVIGRKNEGRRNR